MLEESEIILKERELTATAELESPLDDELVDEFGKERVFHLILTFRGKI